jgi:hypothetical protein
MKRKFKIEKLPYQFVSIDTIGDGSCLLHSVLYSFNKKYRESGFRERTKIVENLRENFSEVLEEKENDKTYYQNLSRGEIEDLSKILKDLDLNYMKSYLCSKKWLNIFYLELISNQLDIDIIIINEKNRKIYKTGDNELLIKKRNTVLVNYIEETHFESIGMVTPEGIKTFFSPDSKVICDLREL